MQPAVVVCARATVATLAMDRPALRSMPVQPAMVVVVFMRLVFRVVELPSARATVATLAMARRVDLCAQPTHAVHTRRAPPSVVYPTVPATLVIREMDRRAPPSTIVPAILATLMLNVLPAPMEPCARATLGTLETDTLAILKWAVEAA